MAYRKNVGLSEDKTKLKSKWRAHIRTTSVNRESVNQGLLKSAWQFLWSLHSAREEGRDERISGGVGHGTWQKWSGYGLTIEPAWLLPPEFTLVPREPKHQRRQLIHQTSPEFTLISGGEKRGTYIPIRKDFREPEIPSKMWFEILPSVAIITIAVGFPHGAAYILNYLIVGNCYRRLLDSTELRMQYLRDRRLTGDPYKVSGLESLPDIDEGLNEENNKCNDSEWNGHGTENGDPNKSDHDNAPVVEEECYQVTEDECPKEECHLN
ncbi:hypothetical protein NQ315_011375 [Exocentrus adspersus]|uniref:NADH-ubiquinone oxidoreductase MWFE subunit n=1 Tax=Exocentrus adspersus TaxID=1586481 RepID=A0AAV8VB77_9CUCU|nr:hypothetical protein NQ315_011375 [Exocentrus adspersus]